ncbi:MAG TPA: hypothetical protein VGC66_02330 [Pyrinomonadaceae bacterium]|jgi:hypothetical protein
MRKIRQLCAAAFLAMVLTTSAFAGDIQLPGITAPPPPSQTITGEIQLPSASVAGQMDMLLASDADTLREIALSLLAGALSAF